MQVCKWNKLFSFVSVSNHVLLLVLQTHLLCFPAVFLRFYPHLVVFFQTWPVPRPPLLVLPSSRVSLLFSSFICHRQPHLVPCIPLSARLSQRVFPSRRDLDSILQTATNTPPPPTPTSSPPPLEGFDLWWRSVTGVCPPPPPPHLPLKKRGGKNQLCDTFLRFLWVLFDGLHFHVAPCVSLRCISDSRGSMVVVEGVWGAV